MFSKGTDKASLVAMARIAETAERYEDMCQIMKQLVEDHSALNVEERNLLSVAYKNVIGARRASWRTLNVVDETKEANEALVNEYKRQIEAELKQICEDVLDLLTNHKLITGNNDASTMTDAESEGQVFYLKMAADYYRYLAECVSNDSTDRASKAGEYYEKAYKLAQAKLEPTHPIRLGLALNFSVCQYEIAKDKTKACELAKKAFDDAISKLDSLEEADYKDSTLIMQLLRDNLTLWSSSDGDNEDEA